MAPALESSDTGGVPVLRVQNGGTSPFHPALPLEPALGADGSCLDPLNLAGTASLY